MTWRNHRRVDRRLGNISESGQDFTTPDTVSFSGLSLTKEFFNWGKLSNMRRFCKADCKPKKTRPRTPHLLIKGLHSNNEMDKRYEKRLVWLGGDEEEGLPGHGWADAEQLPSERCCSGHKVMTWLRKAAVALAEKLKSAQMQVCLKTFPMLEHFRVSCQSLCCNLWHASVVRLFFFL